MSVNDREILSISQIILFEKYWSIDIVQLLDSCPLQNPLHTVVLHLPTIVIHSVEYNSHFGFSVSMDLCAYASYAIFLVKHLLNSNQILSLE